MKTKTAMEILAWRMDSAPYVALARYLMSHDEIADEKFAWYLRSVAAEGEANSEEHIRMLEAWLEKLAIFESGGEYETLVSAISALLTS